MRERERKEREEREKKVKRKKRNFSSSYSQLSLSLSWAAADGGSHFATEPTLNDSQSCSFTLRVLVREEKRRRELYLTLFSVFLVLLLLFLISFSFLFCSLCELDRFGSDSRSMQSRDSMVDQRKRSISLSESVLFSVSLRPAILFR